MPWGAKGNDNVRKDLGVVEKDKGENAVDMHVQTTEADINAADEERIHVLSTKLPKEEY